MRWQQLFLAHAVYRAPLWQLTVFTEFCSAIKNGPHKVDRLSISCAEAQGQSILPAGVSKELLLALALAFDSGYGGFDRSLDHDHWGNY